jgi:hypothetical protein
LAVWRLRREERTYREGQRWRWWRLAAAAMGEGRGEKRERIESSRRQARVAGWEASGGKVWSAG